MRRRRDDRCRRRVIHDDLARPRRTGIAHRDHHRLTRAAGRVGKAEDP